MVVISLSLLTRNLHKNQTWHIWQLIPNNRPNIVLLNINFYSPAAAAAHQYFLLYLCSLACCSTDFPEKILLPLVFYWMHLWILTFQKMFFYRLKPSLLHQEARLGARKWKNVFHGFRSALATTCVSNSVKYCKTLLLF